MGINKGNKYGKNNAGKKYNTVLVDTNGRKIEKDKPLKVACFYQGDDLKSCTIWYTHNKVLDCNIIPAYIKKIISKWHAVQNDYYHGTEYAFTDITYAPYLSESHFNSINLDKEWYHGKIR